MVIFAAVVCGLSFGLLGLVFLPFTHPQSVLYSERFDKIATELIFTPEAAYASCPGQKCFGSMPCYGGYGTDTTCLVDGNGGCETFDCSLGQD